MKKIIESVKKLFKKKVKDDKLRYYLWEMNNISNDGWTKLHYKKLYETRLKELNNK